VAIDSRFYASLGALTLESAAHLSGASFAGDPAHAITGIAAADMARAGELAFIDGAGAGQTSLSEHLDVVVVSESARARVPGGAAVIISPLPRFTHSLIASALFRLREAGPASDGNISSSAAIHPGAIISPGAVIGPGAAIGEGTLIRPNAVIGPGVQIGRNCVIGANASVQCALLGDHVTLFAGARVGEAGFGVMPGPQGLEDAPHFGRVILQDRVTVGANACIDRGVFADTIIGERTKIDNLCQIAHNVVLGRSVIIAALAGISGSVRVGDGSMFGGRVGIADHVTVGAGVRLAASAGVLRDVAPGETWGGTPAKPLRQWMRELVWLSKQAAARKHD